MCMECCQPLLPLNCACCCGAQQPSMCRQPVCLHCSYDRHLNILSGVPDSRVYVGCRFTHCTPAVSVASRCVDPSLPRLPPCCRCCWWAWGWWPWWCSSSGSCSSSRGPCQRCSRQGGRWRQQGWWQEEQEQEVRSRLKWWSGVLGFGADTPHAAWSSSSYHPSDSR